MIYEDRVALDTPEGIQLELTLAGVGSRFTSALIDYLIQGVIVAALLFLLGITSSLHGISGGYAVAIWAVASFVLFIGYDIAFEVLNSGRTPGKQLNRLRVVRESGAPVTFTASAVRNILRVFDILPGWYLVGMASILITGRNQRLGDLAAGTLVVRERAALPAEYSPGPSASAGPAWDASAIRQDELDAVVTFLARKWTIAPGARAQIAAEFAARLRPKVGGLADSESDEIFLERVVAAKRRQA